MKGHVWGAELRPLHPGITSQIRVTGLGVSCGQGTWPAQVPVKCLSDCFEWIKQMAYFLGVLKSCSWWQFCNTKYLLSTHQPPLFVERCKALGSGRSLLPPHCGEEERKKKVLILFFKINWPCLFQFRVFGLYSKALQGKRIIEIYGKRRTEKWKMRAQ